MVLDWAGMTDGLKNGAYVYLLQRYLGQYFENKINPNELSVNLLKGTCTLRNLRLDVQALNELADKQNWPFEFVNGWIGKIKVDVPWASVLSESSSIEVTDLKITAQPKQRKESATSMFESMWSSMTSSLHLAEECAQQVMSTSPSVDSQPFIGIESFAAVIESVLNRVKVTFLNSVFQIEHLPKGSSVGVGIVFNINSIKYNDESCSDPPREEATNFSSEDTKKAYVDQAYISRSTRLDGITISTVEFCSRARSFTQCSMQSSFDSHYMNEPESSEADCQLPSEDRNIIMFGQFDRKIEVIVRLKRTEELEGPKVSVEVNMGPLLVFLTPRQLHLLTELAKGLASPDLGDHSNVLTTKYKRMSVGDFERLERDLQQQLPSPLSNFHSSGLPTGHAWATGATIDSDSEEFTPLHKHSEEMYGSNTSLASTAESSMSSSVISSYTGTEIISQTRRRLNKIDTDPSAEISRFEIHLFTLCVILLHEDILIESSEHKGSLAPSSLQQMQSVIKTFFSKAAQVFKSKDFKNSNLILNDACKASHLRLLASSVHMEGDEKTTNSAFSISGFLEADKLELSENLYESSKHDQYVELLKFKDLKSSDCFDTAKPSLRLDFRHVEKTSKGAPSKSGPKTDLSFTLDKCYVEFDVTIIDRITALLNPQPICVVPKDVNLWTPPNDNESKIDFKISSASATVNVRFPKPDFRPPHDMNRVPWYRRSIRTDFLSLVLNNASFQMTFQSSQNCQEFSLQCKNLNVYYYDDDTSTPVSIAKAGFEDKSFTSMQDILSNCKLNVRTFLKKRAVLDEVPRLTQDPMAMSVAGYLETQQVDNGPFTSKKIFYESDTPHSKNQPDCDSKELLVPGEKFELDNFIKQATASSSIQIEIFLPTLSMQLVSKHLYEVIYNRINNDLLLWQPSAPKPKVSTSFYEDSGCPHYVNLDIDTQETFTLCKSAIPCDSSESEEDEESTNVFHSAYSVKSRYQPKQAPVVSRRESYLSLSLSVGRGLFFMCPPVRDMATNNVIPGQQGEILMNVEDANVFLVNGYMGDMNLGYLCLELHNAQLHHCDMTSVPSQSPPLKDVSVAPGQYLHPTIYKSENGMLATSNSRGANREMVTVCIKIKANHETHHVKNVAVGIGFNKVTLRHRMCNEPNAWISQLIDFFNVQDYPIPGYNTKEVLTELYVHFWDSAIDYRPRYIPVRAALTFGTFSISSHLSAEANTSTLRFIAEECNLFLSEKGSFKNKTQYTGPVDLKRDYVNVIELGQFELSLKTSDKKNTETPHFDLRASNNIIHIRTCVDSARALTQIIQYLANNGDLLPSEDMTSSGSSYCSPRHQPEPELVSVEPQEVVNVSESQQQKIHDLIQDALDEDLCNQPSSRRASAEFYSLNGPKLFYFPDENQPLPLQDSVKPLPQVTLELGEAGFDRHSDDAEDDFCFIDEEPGCHIFPKNGIPEIKWLTEDPVRMIENHFCVPSEKSDPLKAPKSFPTPVSRYTLCEMSIIWNMYGGNDFDAATKDVKKTVNFSDGKLKDTVAFSRENVHINREKKAQKNVNWVERGGASRDHDAVMQLHLNKIRFQHEDYPETSSKASRQVLIISELEMMDRLKVSQINKFLHQYTSQQRPKQSNANMVVIKSLHVRPDPQLRAKECSLKISLLPLRFHIDQDALQFLINFFTELGGEPKENAVPATGSNKGTPNHQPPVMTITKENERSLKEQAKKIVDENLLILLDENRKMEEDSKEEAQTSCGNSEEQDAPFYFRNVVFSPDVPIKLDYVGKRVDLSHGPLHGTLLGLGQLNCSELRLKRIRHRHGILGFEKLMAFLIKEWLNDIKKNQIPNLLYGVGPLHAIVQLFQGIRDLFCLPFEQYKKDGRFLRGLHRGAHSFTTSTFTAALEITTRVILAIQITAETAFDMLNPGPGCKARNKTKKRHLRQPKDIREGVANALALVKEGIEETAENIIQIAAHEREQKGYSGAVGGVIRQIPPTVIKPIILASEATNNVLGGMRFQLLPDARREDNAKWRRDDSNM